MTNLFFLLAGFGIFSRVNKKLCHDVFTHLFLWRSPYRCLFDVYNGLICCDYRQWGADDEIHPESFKELPMMNQQGFVFVFSIIVETWRMWVQKSSGRCK